MGEPAVVFGTIVASVETSRFNCCERLYGSPLTVSVMPACNVNGTSPIAALELAERVSVQLMEPFELVTGVPNVAVIPAGSVEVIEAVGEPEATVIPFFGTIVTVIAVL